MAILARDVLRRCIDILQDSTNVRWPLPELTRLLNDGQREIVLYRPDSTVTTANVTLAEGSLQSLPADASKLIEITRNNTASNKSAVRLINREILDAQTPEWHNLTAVESIKHYMYDARNPLEFYVYPPATATSVLEVIYSKYPVDVEIPAPADELADITDTIGVPDVYANALQDYILYRAYSKDSEYAGNAQRAQAHYATFANSLGVEIQSTIQVAPNPIFNPNIPTRAPAQ